MANRVILGERANGDSGLFISPSGVNADTAADIDLSFSSMLTHGYTVHAKGMIGPLTTSPQTATFPTLSYVPQVIGAYYDSANQYYFYTQTETKVAGDPQTGTYTPIVRVGPSLTVTTSSISMTASSTLVGLYGHYVILRQPGGF